MLAIVHPINSAGSFEPDAGAGEPFVIRDSYFAARRCMEDVERDGLSMRFVCEHRPLEDYARALEEAGFAIEALREVTEPDAPGPLVARSRWFSTCAPGGGGAGTMPARPIALSGHPERLRSAVPLRSIASACRPAPVARNDAMMRRSSPASCRFDLRWLVGARS